MQQIVLLGILSCTLFLFACSSVRAKKSRPIPPLQESTNKPFKKTLAKILAGPVQFLPSLERYRQKIGPKLWYVREEFEKKGSEPYQVGASFSIIRPKQPILEIISPTTDIGYSSKMLLNGKEISELIKSTTLHHQWFEQTKNIRELMVTHEAYITYNGIAEAVEKTPIKTLIISLAAVNLAYSQEGSFELEQLEASIPYKSDFEDIGYTPGEELSASATAKYRKLVSMKWGSILELMNQNKVEVAVLPALGMGSFLPAMPDAKEKVLHINIEAMQKAFVEYKHKFKAIIFSIPAANNMLFAKFSENLKGLSIVSPRNMFDLAFELSMQQIRCGLVNASDKEALISGNLGQFWQTGHVALEETLPYMTTSLLNNWAYSQHMPPGYLQLLEKFKK